MKHRQQRSLSSGAFPIEANTSSHSSTCSAWAKAWLPGLLLVLLVFTAYLPTFKAGFIWDDDFHLTANRCVVGPLGLKELWTTSAARICPLVQTSFWLEYRLWGLRPLPYHLVNLFFFALSGVWLWRVLLALEIPGAWLGAALWSLHPVQVESAAWITEMKNTQSGFFYLLAILFFVKWEKTLEAGWGRRWFYLVALFFGILAMASKSSTVILPLVLLLCTWWIARNWSWKNILPVIPFAIFSMAAAGVSMWTQKLEGASGVEYARTLAERMATAGDVVWFYLGKLLWPYPLIFIYPRWKIDPAQILTWLPALSAALLLVLFWWKRQGWGRSYFFASACFVVCLLPVLGIIDHFFLRYSFVGDHFQYLASMGVLAAVGAGVWAACDAFSISFFKPIAGTLLLAILGTLTWHHAASFQDSENLWRDTLAKNPACWMAHNNLGIELADQGKLVEAVEHYQTAMQLKPEYIEVRNNLGVALAAQGRLPEAIQQYQAVLQSKPDYAEAYYNLGNALATQGRLAEAVPNFQKAIQLKLNYAEAYNRLGLALARQGSLAEAMANWQKVIQLKPDYAEVYNNLGLAMAKQGKLAEAIVYWQKVVQLKPDDLDAHYSLGNAFSEQGQLAEAVQNYQKTLQLKPDQVEACNKLALVLAKQGRLAEAIADWQKAIQLKPDFAEAHNNLGLALVQTGRIDEAVIEYQAAIKFNPDDAKSYNNLAWLRATHPDARYRDGEQAVALGKRAVGLLPDDPAMMDTLAAAYAETGQFSEAITVTQRALKQAATQGNSALVADLQTHLQSYQAARPIRVAIP
jgi:tetratricopeptide (TPR) repeat protein